MPMKKLVFIHLFNDRSGSPKVLSQVIQAATHQRIPTHVLTSAQGEGFLTGLGDVQQRLFYRRSENKLLTLGYYLVSQGLLFVQCLKYRRQNVVFYLNTMLPFGAALAGKLLGIPVYYHVHETSIKPDLLKRFLRLVIARTCSQVVFVSHYLRRVEGFAKLPQVVIHNALDSPFAPRCRIRQGPGFTVLMVCSLKVYKGVLEFLALARRSLDHPHLNFTLVLNASDAEVEHFFRRLGVPGNLTLHSRQSDLSGFYADADLLLNLSRTDGWVETFGLTILEGMAHGLPVIVPPVGGPAELVRDDVEGYLICAYQTEELYRALCRLAADPDTYRRLSANAQARAGDFRLEAFQGKCSTLFAGMRHARQ